MKKAIFLTFNLLFLSLLSEGQAYENSRFGASAVSWANWEGWNNYQELGFRYIRMAVDVQKGAIIDNFFLTQYDNYVTTAQSYDLQIFGIVNPKRNVLEQWAEFSEFAQQFRTIVERYDGDGFNDMPGLIYPIKNWEICNEIRWGNLCDSDPNCQWKNFGRTRYLQYMDTARYIVTNYCQGCNFLNGSQVGPPSAEIISNGYSSLSTLIDSLGTGIIDGISYHSYSNRLMADTAVQDFVNLGINDKEIWATEADMQVEYMLNPALSQDDNAIMCTKSFIYAFYKGFDRIIYTSVRASVTDTTFVKWGSLLEPTTGGKRKICWAYKKMIEKLDYFTNVTTASPHNGTTVFAFKFTVQNKPVYLLWANSPQTVNLNLSGSSVQNVVVTSTVPDDTSGNFTTQVVPATSGSVSLDISTTAIYVEEDDGMGVTEEISGINRVEIYPNPAIKPETVKIKIPALNINSIRISDVCGRETPANLIKIENPLILATDKLKSGIYIINISSSTSVYNTKLQIFE